MGTSDWKLHQKNIASTIVTSDFLLRKRYLPTAIFIILQKRSVVIWYWCKSACVKEVINPVQKVIFNPKRSLKILKSFRLLACREWIQCVTETKWKNLSYHFHPHFRFDNFTSLPFWYFLKGLEIYLKVHFSYEYP